MQCLVSDKCPINISIETWVGFSGTNLQDLTALRLTNCLNGASRELGLDAKPVLSPFVR